MRLAAVGGGSALTAALTARLRARPEISALTVVDAADAAALVAALTAADRLLYLPATPFAGDPDPATAAGVLEAWQAVPRPLVLLSSTAVYTPATKHPGMVGEAAVSARGRRQPLAASWLRLERQTRSAGAAPVTVLRAAPVPLPDGDDAWSRLLAARLAPVVAGHDPPLQLLALDDLAAAVYRALTAPAAGGEGVELYHLVPPEVVPLRAALRLAGARALPLPGPLHRRLGAARRRLHDHLRYPFTAGGGAWADRYGWAPARSSAATAAALGAARGVRRRMPAARYDDHGMRRGVIDFLGRTLFRFLRTVYWRLEVAGLEHLPPTGRALLVGSHRGFMPFDGIMVLDVVARAIGRYPRFLIHPTLLRFPFVFDLIRALGGVVASAPNAERVLQADGLLGVFPEGIRGGFALYREGYALKRFGRHDFVRFALRSGAPIVPFVTVGNADALPILGRIDWAWWKRWSGWPFLPRTPTFPLPLPLPSKWHLRFLPPIDVAAEHPPSAAEDPRLVRALSARVRRQMDHALADILARRRWRYAGRLRPPAT